MTFTSLSVDDISTKGSLSEEIDGCSNKPLPAKGDFTLPNSLIFGFPSGPMVMEYPYTIGPTSLTFPPSGVSYSLTNSFGTLFSIFLNGSENVLSIWFLISSNSLNRSLKFQLPKGVRPLNNLLYQSYGFISLLLIVIFT